MKLTVKEMCLCALFAVLIAVGAFIKIPISIVPITMQTLFVVIAGIVLGRKVAFFSVMLYIVIGLIGLPVFANGGGIMYVVQPTFGYLIGFAVAAYGIGYVSDKYAGYRSLLVFSILGMVVIYAIGMLYFVWIQNVYYGIPFAWGWVFYYLFLVYLPGDLIACIVGAYIGKRIKNSI